MAQPPGSETLRLAHARDQRRQHPEAGAHLGDELVGRGGVDDAGRGNVQRLAVIGGLAGALAADHDVDAVIAEDALEQADVGEARHVVEDQGLLGEEARDHQRQRGVLGARDRDGAVERPAADDTNAIHFFSPRGPLRAHPLRRPLSRPDCGESRERPPISASAAATSSALRPRACSLRRLRFSRKRADSRSLRAAHFSALPGLIMAAISKHAARGAATVRRAGALARIAPIWQ